MKSLLAILLLTGCTTTLPNGCLVDAISHRQATEAKARLMGATSFNEVLSVWNDGDKMGHCYNVFSWPDGEFWAYDRRGSQRVYADMADAMDIARNVRPSKQNGRFLE